MSRVFIAVSKVSLPPDRARAITPITNGRAIMMMRNVRSALSAEAYRRTSVPSWAVRLRGRGGAAMTTGSDRGCRGWAVASAM